MHEDKHISLRFKPRKSNAYHAASIGNDLGCVDSPIDLPSPDLKEKTKWVIYAKRRPQILRVGCPG